MLPSFKEFSGLAKKYESIPLSVHLIADSLTPISVLHHFEKEKNIFLLESVSEGTSVSRYSFIGFGKTVLFKSYEKKIEIIDNGIKKQFESNDPLGELAKYTCLRKCAPMPNLPVFQGGGVGYIGYDLFRTVEHLPNCPKDDLEVPEILFGFHEILLAFDHVKRSLLVITNVKVDGKGKGSKAAYENGMSKINQVVEKLKKVKPLNLIENFSLTEPFKKKVKSNMSQKKYEDSIGIIKEHIKAGDIFQCVMGQRLEAEVKAKPLDIYRALRAINPSPYLFYLKFDELLLLGSSPEILVSVDETKTLTLKPIAGTRPRGKNEKEDKALMEDLLADSKEISEHTMLVDLARNDLGRVCEYKSIRIEDCLQVELYSHVMHIVSTVSGKLRKKLNAMDAFKACFPAGTLTGAPKIRAMQILDSLEPTKRGAFGGGVGYFDFRGNLDTCITIRTMLIKDGIAYVQAGAGVVADSIPKKEYEETVNKSRGLLKALEVAENYF